jgi:hypothetical protein
VPRGHLLSILKKKIKNKINISKTIFYAFEVLNARNLRQNFYFNMLNQCPGALFSIFLKVNLLFALYKGNSWIKQITTSQHFPLGYYSTQHVWFALKLTLKTILEFNNTTMCVSWCIHNKKYSYDKAMLLCKLLALWLSDTWVHIQMAKMCEFRLLKAKAMHFYCHLSFI